jgi:hypothetical protein
MTCGLSISEFFKACEGGVSEAKSVFFGCNHITWAAEKIADRVLSSKKSF